MGRRIWQIEIRVSDLKRAIAFYSSVFDWRITALSDEYAMADTGRAPIVSIWQVGDSGMPLGVCHYVQSEDCVVDAGRAVELGGRVAVERSEVPDAGAWTDTLDPWNNELAFWQAETMGEPEHSGSATNAISWVEIGVGDLQQARHYFSELVGWNFKEVDGVEDYAIETELQPGLGLVGGERGGRLRGMTDYVRVADLARASRAVAENGGEVLGEPVDVGDGSLFSLFLDPDQNRFGLVQPA